MLALVDGLGLLRTSSTDALVCPFNIDGPVCIRRQYKLLNVSAAFPPNSNGAQRMIGGSGEHMVTAGLGGVMQPMMGSTVSDES